MDPQTYSAMMALIETIDGKADEMLKRQSITNGRVNDLEERVAGVEATCAARGSCAQKAGFVVSWKVALMLAVAILTAGALMGTEGARVLASVIKP